MCRAVRPSASPGRLSESPRRGLARRVMRWRLSPLVEVPEVGSEEQFLDPASGLGRRIDAVVEVPGPGAVLAGRTGAARRDHPPFDRDLALDPFEVDIADDDPMLVGRWPVLQCPQGQRLQGPRATTVRPPAGLLVGVDVDGPIHRNRIPPAQFDPGNEVAVPDQRLVLGHLRHDVARLADRTVGLHQERQHRRPSSERLGSDVPGVCIAQPGHDGGQLVVEGQVAEALGPLLQQSQSLDRVRPVHRPLEWEMGVEPLDQSAKGLDHLVAHVERDLGNAVAARALAGWEVVAERGAVLRLADDRVTGGHA